MKAINQHLTPGDLEATRNTVYLLVADRGHAQGIYLVILNDDSGRATRLSAGTTLPLPIATYAVQVGEVQSSR